MSVVCVLCVLCACFVCFVCCVGVVCVVCVLCVMCACFVCCVCCETTEFKETFTKITLHGLSLFNLGLKTEVADLRSETAILGPTWSMATL